MLEANRQSSILVKTLMIAQCLWLVADLYFDGFMANAKSLHDEVYYNVEGSLGDKERRGRVVESVEGVGGGDG